MKILNKEYWKRVPTNETTSVDIKPSNDDLRHIPANGKILDIGCGDGQLSEWLAARGFSVDGIDINPHAIEGNNTRIPKVHYSLQDIAEGTTFPNHQFDLLCSKFTLANIHKEEWPAVRKEIERLIRSGGFVWLVEPLVSSDYQKRYDLSKKLLGDERAIFVFKDSEAARNITTAEQLQVALDQRAISRISRHFTKEEITNTLFPNFKIIQEKIIEITSPSGFTLNTLIALLQQQALNH